MPVTFVFARTSGPSTFQTVMPSAGSRATGDRVGLDRPVREEVAGASGAAVGEAHDAVAPVDRDG